MRRIEPVIEADASDETLRALHRLEALVTLESRPGKPYLRYAGEWQVPIDATADFAGIA